MYAYTYAYMYVCMHIISLHITCALSLLPSEASDADSPVLPKVCHITQRQPFQATEAFVPFVHAALGASLRTLLGLLRGLLRRLLRRLQLLRLLRRLLRRLLGDSLRLLLLLGLLRLWVLFAVGGHRT